MVSFHHLPISILKCQMLITKNEEGLEHLGDDEMKELKLNAFILKKPFSELTDAYKK